MVMLTRSQSRGSTRIDALLARAAVVAMTIFAAGACGWILATLHRRPDLLTSSRTGCVMVVFLLLTTAAARVGSARVASVRPA
jgi:hypothetical protein